MSPNRSMGAPMRGQAARRGAFRLSLCAPFLAAGLAACEGANLFSGEGAPGGEPTVLELSSTTGSVVRDTLNMRVDATAARGVARIVLTLEGAAARDTTVIVSPPQPQVSRNIRMVLPGVLNDTLLRVRATAVDVQGRASRGRTLQLTVSGPPNVTSLSAPPAIRAGEVINVTIEAAGVRRITSVALRVRGAFSKDTAIAIEIPQRSLSRIVTFQVPPVVQDTLLRLTATAVDETGVSSAPRNRDIPFVIDPPVLSLLAPLQARAGDRLDLDILAMSLRGITQIRIQLRGAVVKDTTVRPDPVRAEFAQIVSVGLPGAITTSALTVSAYAIDAGGAVSETQSRNVQIPLGPPVVIDVEVPGGVFNNSVADVRVYAEGLRPLARIDVQFRGAVDADRSYTVSPQRHEVVQDASITVPAVPKDVVLIVRATAIDVAGATSAIETRVIPVTVTSPEGSSAPNPGAQRPPGPRPTPR